MIQEKFWIMKICRVVSEYFKKCDAFYKIKTDTRASLGFYPNIELPREPM